MSLLTLVLAVPGPAAAQFSAQPVILDLRTADSAAAAVFTVRNESDATVQLRVYAGDFDQPVEGGHEFLDAGSHARSCAARLRFYPDHLVLPARASADVRVVMDPGEETCWSLVFVESVAAGGSGIRISQRIGVKVYGVSTRAAPAGEVAAVEVVSDPSGAWAVLVDFRNEGATPLRPEGEVELRTESGDVVAVVRVAPFSVLPGRTRRVAIPLGPALSPGGYLVIPILDFGGDYLAGGQASFMVGG